MKSLIFMFLLVVGIVFSMAKDDEEKKEEETKEEEKPEVKETKGKGRRRSRRRSRGDKTVTTTTNAGSDILLPDVFSRWRISNEQIEGEVTSQVGFTYCNPNVVVHLVSGGYTSAMPSGEFVPAASGRLSSVTTRWYSEDVDDSVSDKAWIAIQQAVGRRIYFNTYDIQAYIAGVSNLYAKYCALQYWLPMAILPTSAIGTLGEVPEGIRALFKESFEQVPGQTGSSDWIESLATLRIIEGQLQQLALPTMRQSDIQLLFTPRRAGPLEDDPIVGFAPTMQRIGGETSSNYTPGTAVPASVESLRQDLAIIRSMIGVSDIAAAIISVYGEETRLKPVETVTLGEDVAWSTIWENVGVVVDDRSVALPNDTVVPNAGDPDRTKQFLVPMDLRSEVNELFLKYFSHGNGKKVEDAAAYALLNYTSGAAGDFDYNKASRTLIYGNTSPVLNPVRHPLTSNEDDIGDAMIDVALRKARLGWKKSMQEKSVTAPEEQKGIRQSVTNVGRRYRVNTSRIRERAHLLYLAEWDVSG